MGLLQINKETITSNTSSVSLTGITDNEVYQIHCIGVLPQTDGAYFQLRVLESGTPNTTSNYDKAHFFIRANSTFTDLHNENQSAFTITNHTHGTAGGETGNLIIDVYNAYDSNLNTLFSVNGANRDSGGNLYTSTGMCIFTSDSSVNGIQFFYHSGDINQAEFTLYKVV